MKQHQLSVDIGTSSSTTGLIKEALLCRTGSFEGMNGPVEVSQEWLQNLCDTYLKVRSAPANENDYAPILLNHDRNVELIKGRLLTEGLCVKPWKEIDGEMQFGLFGNLRIDDEAAKKNVEDGKYAHLSISFDEEKWEIFEVSFVAVEAARGSIVLSHGGINMDLEKKIKTLSQKHQALAALTKESRTRRKAELAKLAKKSTELSQELDGLMKKSSEIRLSVKSAQIKGKFNEFVRGGKMNPVELKDLDFKELASMSETSLKVVLASYEKRAVMTDVLQYGQSGTETKFNTELSKENMRKAIELQRAGKNKVILADGAEDNATDDESENDDGDGNESGAEKTPKSYAMDEEAYAKCLEEISGVHEKLSGLMEKFKAMGADTEKLAESEETDEKKELATVENDEGDK